LFEELKVRPLVITWLIADYSSFAY
jgi:hypothetical protein